MKAKKKVEEGAGFNSLFGKVALKPDTVEVEKGRVNLFSFVDSISASKDYIYDETTAGEYNQWLINRAFMLHTDTVYHAALMNHWSQLDKKMHHDYLFYSLPKKKRWKKWLKQSEEEKAHHRVIEGVARLLNYSVARTKQAWTLMNEDQRNKLIEAAFPDSKNDKKRF